MGLPILFVGNYVVDCELLKCSDILKFTIGFSLCVFGCWTFSKLMPQDEFGDAGSSIIGIPLIAAVLWFVNQRYIQYDLSTLYVLRIIGCLMLGLYSFKGYRK